MAPVLARGLLLLSICVLAQPSVAQARDDDGRLQVGRGLICATGQQVERYVTLFDGDAQKTMGVVNSEANDTSACTVASVIFIPESAGATVRNATGAYRVVQIVVFGVVTAAGVHKVGPLVRFAATPVEEIEI